MGRYDWEYFEVGEKVICRKIDFLGELKIGEKYIIRDIRKNKNTSYNEYSHSAPIVFLEGKSIGFFIWRFMRAPRIIDEGEDE